MSILFFKFFIFFYKPIKTLDFTGFAALSTLKKYHFFYVFPFFSILFLSLQMMQRTLHFTIFVNFHYNIGILSAFLTWICKTSRI